MLLSGNIKGVTTVVAYVDTNGGFYSFSDILTKRDIASKFPNLFLTSGDLDVPYLDDSTAQAFNQVFDIFLSNKDKINDNVLTSIKATIDSIVNLPLETYKLLFETTLKLEKYLSGEVDFFIDFPLENYNNFSKTKKLVDAINSKNSIQSTVVDNVTKFRKTPDDELFIAVPTADTLSFFPISNFIPSMSTVFIPYKDPKLKSVEYKRFLQATGTSIEEVEGSSENVTGELYPEEKRFYDALCNLHKALLQFEYPNQSVEDCIKYKVSSKVFREYIIQMTLKVLAYHWNHKGFLPIGYESDDDDDEDSDNENAGNNSESADSNKLFHAIRTDLSDGESIISGVLNSEFSKDIFYPIDILIQCMRFGKKKPSKIKLFDDKSYFDLNTFMYANTSGSYSSYEIKKTPSGCIYSPTAIIQANSRIFDGKFINQHKIIKPIIDVPVGLICKKEFQGTDEYQLAVISFVDLISNYGKDDSLTIEGVEVTPNGIKLNDKFSSSLLNLEANISLGDTLTFLRNSSDGFYISYVSPNVRDTYMDFNAFSNKLSTLGIFNDFIEKDDLTKLDVLSATSKEELKLKCTDYRLAPGNLLNITVGLNYCKLISQVNDKYAILQEEDPYCNLSNVLDIYKNCMDDQGYYGNVFFADDMFNVPTTQNNLQSTSVFSNNKEIAHQVTEAENKAVVGEEKQNTEQQAVKSTNTPQPSEQKSAPESPFGMIDTSVLFDTKEFSNVVSIVMTEAEVAKVNSAFEAKNSKMRVKELGTFKTNIVVGYLGITEDKTFYFLDPINKGTESRQSYSLAKFKPNMIALLRVLIKGRPCKVRFSNIEALDYYGSIVERI